MPTGRHELPRRSGARTLSAQPSSCGRIARAKSRTLREAGRAAGQLFRPYRQDPVIEPLRGCGMLQLTAFRGEPQAGRGSPARCSPPMGGLAADVATGSDHSGTVKPPAASCLSADERRDPTGKLTEDERARGRVRRLSPSGAPRRSRPRLTSWMASRDDLKLGLGARSRNWIAKSKRPGARGRRFAGEAGGAER